MGTAADVHVVLCPPSVYLSAVDAVLDGSPIGLGGQNMHWEPGGAYTGEVSGAMLVDAGCTHVILGHSERRHGLGETDAQVNAKLLAALASHLIPIVCLGETKDQRLRDETEAVLAAQLTGSLAGLSPEQMAGTVLAYEPVWAIGTGLTATPGAGPVGPRVHPRPAGGPVRRSDRGSRRRPVWRERQAGQRCGTAGMPRHRRCPRRRSQPEGQRFPGNLPRHGTLGTTAALQVARGHTSLSPCGRSSIVPDGGP